MFNFFKNNPVQDDEDDDSVLKKEDRTCSVAFHTDKEGYIWIDCSWSANADAHLQFAELLEKVSSGDMIEDTLEYIRESCQSDKQKSDFLELLAYITKLQQKRILDALKSPNHGSLTREEEPLVSPLNVTKM